MKWPSKLLLSAFYLLATPLIVVLVIAVGMLAIWKGKSQATPGQAKPTTDESVLTSVN